MRWQDWMGLISFAIIAGYAAAIAVKLWRERKRGPAGVAVFLGLLAAFVAVFILATS